MAEDRIPTGEVVSVFDAIAPPGAGPLSVNHRASSGDARSVNNPIFTEIYSWADGTWRTLPLTGQPNATATATSPVEDAEVNRGLVRIRTINSDEGLVYAYSQLVPREG